MTKGTETKIDIISSGLEMASQLGLECVTIGLLAKETNLSKSGLFAHFKSKENLQLEILKYAAEDFSKNVILPALKVRAGISRIKALVKNWIDWGNNLTGGCIFVTAGIEYSDRPGKVRDLLIMQQEQWINSLCRIANSAIKAGDFKTEIDVDQFAFDLYSMLLGFHYYYKLLNDKNTNKRQEFALEQLLLKYKS
jgi:AcrR family transcriptional regulator